MAQLHMHGSPEDARLLVWSRATQPGPAACLLVDQTGGFHSKKRLHLAPACSITNCTSHEMRCENGGSDSTSYVATPVLASHLVTSVNLPAKEKTCRKRPAAPFLASVNRCK